MKLMKIKIWLFIWYLKRIHGYSKVSTKLLYAQAWHETGNFKSKVFKQNKNLFGMRHPSIRKTYSQGSNLGHAIFKNYWDSIRDYFERQKNFNIPNTSDSEYITNTVNSNYAEDVNYSSKWLNVANTIKMPVNNWFIFGGLFFLVLIVFFIFYLIKKSNK